MFQHEWTGIFWLFSVKLPSSIWLNSVNSLTIFVYLRLNWVNRLCIEFLPKRRPILGGFAPQEMDIFHGPPSSRPPLLLVLVSPRAQERFRTGFIGARGTCTLLDLFSCTSLVTDSEVLAQLALVDGLATTRSSVNPWGRNILAPALLRTSKNYHASAKFWSSKRLYLAGPYASVNADPPIVRAAAATAAMCCHAVLS